MSVLKIIDLYAAVDIAELTTTQARRVPANEWPSGRITRGDELNLRWHMFSHESALGTFAIPLGAGLEFVVSTTFQIYDDSQILAYAPDSEFDPALWASYDRASGLVACRVNTNTTNMLAAMGTDDEQTYYAALIMTPPGGGHAGNSSSSSVSSESSPFGPGEHVTLAQFELTVANDVWRIGQADPVTIHLEPFSLLSSSSSSSSSTAARSTSSLSSSSTLALVSSSSSSSVSESSLSSQSSTSVSSSSSSSTKYAKSSSSSTVGRSTTSTVGMSTSSPSSSLSSSSSSSSTLAMSTSSPSTSDNSPSSSNSSSSSGDYTANLVLWLEADDAVAPTGTWSDKSGNNNDCVLTNDAYVTKGEGLILDGAGDYGTVAQAAELEFGTNDFSISFWVKTSTANNGMACHYGDRSDSSGISTYAIVATSSKAQMNLDDGANTMNSKPTTATNNGAWHHVVFSADRTANLIAYTDGGAAEDTDDMTAIGDLDTADHDDWLIGCSWDGAALANYLTGTLDDIRFYSVALSQLEVQAIYDNSDHNPTRSSSSSSST